LSEFILKRLFHLIPTIILISLVSFVIINLPPGDYLTARITELELQGDTSAREHLERLRTHYGLDQPIFVQYWLWATRFVQGDFGFSFEYNQPARELIMDRLLLTMILSVGTLFFTWIVAIPIGIISATHPRSLFDRIATLFSFVGMATPGFLLALVLLVFVLYAFDVSLMGLFSPEFRNAPWSVARVLDLLKHIWLPIMIIGVQGMAGLVRIMRANMLDILGQQYITTARSKGLQTRIVIYKHALRVAINPLISIAGMSLPQIIGGEMLTSIVLNLPTTGPLFYRALMVQDMYLAGSFLMFLVVFLVVGNFLADLALAWTDPRIRYN